MTTNATAHSLSEFLSFVPHLTGYPPSESVVLIPMQQGRTRGAMRFNLPSNGIEPGAFAAVASDTLHRTMPDSAIIVIYAERITEEHEALVASLADAIEVAVIEAAYLSATSYGSFFSGETGPASDVKIDPKLGTVREVNEPDTLPDLSDADFARSLGAMAEGTSSSTRGVPNFIERLLIGGQEYHAQDAGQLASILECPSLRDVALVTVTLGKEDGDRAAMAQEAWENGAEYPMEFAQMLFGVAPRPNPKRLELALVQARYAAAVSSAAGYAGALAACAWLSWALGRSTHAQHYVTRALALNPEHGLAGVVSKIVASGHLPEWAFTGN